MASTDEDLLAQPLDDGDLAERIEAAGGRRWRRSTVVLGALVLVVLGFALGAAMGRGAAEFRAAMEAGQGDDAPAEPASEDGPGTAEPAAKADTIEGVVRAVDGNIVYVEAADGTVVRVEVTEDTEVSAVEPIDVGQLVPGAPVVAGIQEEADDGATATSIQQAPDPTGGG